MSLNSEFSTMTLAQASEGLRNGTFSSVELVRAMHAAIDEKDSVIGAYLAFDAEGALAAAEAADTRRAAGEYPLLLGIPIALKDMFNIKGQPCTCASKILEGYIAPYDATVITRLKAAGAIPAGRLNMDEFAMGTTTEHSAFQVTRNPVDPTRVPGGSSGGSAAAVAGGLALASLGTDTGGSIRQPASFCGCVGVKPSYGRVSRFGVVGSVSSMDQVGPITKTVEDAAILLQAIAGLDAYDQTTVNQPVPDYVAALRDASLKGLRIGVPKECFLDQTDPEVVTKVRAAIDACADAGAEVREISLPHTAYASAVYSVCAAGEASASLARFDGVRYGRRRGAAEDGLQALYNRTRAEGFGAEVKRRIILGTFVLSSGNYDRYYHRAQQARTLIRRDFEAAFAHCDVLMSPTTPTPAYLLNSKNDDALQASFDDAFTVAANLAGICGLSIPCGRTKAHLPVGLQVLAPAFGEVALLRAAEACRRELGV